MESGKPRSCSLGFATFRGVRETEFNESAAGQKRQLPRATGRAAAPGYNAAQHGDKGLKGDAFMRGIIFAAVAAATLGLGSALVIAAEAPSAGAAQLALATIPVKGAARLTVTSPAFPAGGDIPFENTQYRGNIFPGLSWTKGPSGTRSYVIIMQDPDSISSGMPILHWTMFNIPASVTELDAAMQAPPSGASYGPNIRGPNQAYMGPHTPPGPKHHYHLQLFALDTMLAPDAANNYAALIGAMNAHVLAEGELVGLAQADPNAPPRAPTPAPPKT
jgi:para-nitrobenzyl esterase